MFLLNLIFIWCELGVIERECYYWNLPPVVAHQKLLIIRLPLSDALLLAALVFQDIFSVVCVCACVAVCVENEKQKKTQPKCMGYDTAPHSLDITCKITFSMSSIPMYLVYAIIFLIGASFFYISMSLLSLCFGKRSISS